MIPTASRVLVVSANIDRSDRIVGELIAFDVDPVPAYTAGEALGRLSSERFDAVIVDEDLEEGVRGLRHWLKDKFRGVVVFMAEGEAEFVEAPDPRAVSEGAEVTRRVLVAMRERGRDAGVSTGREISP